MPIQYQTVLDVGPKTRLYGTLSLQAGPNDKNKMSLAVVCKVSSRYMTVY